jgi:hypothetical protein
MKDHSPFVSSFVTFIPQHGQQQIKPAADQIASVISSARLGGELIQFFNLIIGKADTDLR